MIFNVYDKRWRKAQRERNEGWREDKTITWLCGIPIESSDLNIKNINFNAIKMEAYVTLQMTFWLKALSLFDFKLKESSFLDN